MQKFDFAKIIVLSQTIDEDYAGYESYAIGKQFDIRHCENVPISSFEMIAKKLPDFDIILNSSSETITFAQKIAKLMSKPITSLLYKIPDHLLKYPFWQQSYMQRINNYNDIDAVFCFSEEVYYKAFNLGFHNDDVIFIPIGVEDASDVEIIPMSNNGDPVNIISIGESGSFENVEDFLFSARENPDKRFIWVTSDTLRDKFSEKMDQLDNVNIITDIGDYQRFTIIKSIDYLLYSQNDDFLLYCIEALKCGTTVIVKYSKNSIEQLWKYGDRVIYYETIRDLQIILDNINKVETKNPPVGFSIAVTVTGIMEKLYDVLIRQSYQKIHGRDDVYHLSSTQKSRYFDEMVQFKTEKKQLFEKISLYKNNEKFRHLVDIIGSDNISDARIGIIGVGDGTVSANFIENGSTVESMDISTIALKNVDEFFETSDVEYTITQYDIENPYYKSDKYDVLIVDEVLTHTDDMAMSVINVLDNF